MIAHVHWGTEYDHLPDADLASVRSAVNGIGGNRGLVEERLPR